MAHVILAGFMGTGKSTVGRLLADRMGCPFIDCDEEIEAVAKKPISGIFAESGEDAFRALESRVLSTLLRRDETSIIALGGGALTSRGEPVVSQTLRTGDLSRCRSCRDLSTGEGSSGKTTLVKGG